MSDITREQMLASIAEADAKCKELAKLFPGCFTPDGRAIVAVAALPYPPPICCGMCGYFECKCGPLGYV